MIDTMQDGQVTLLGEVTDLDEALKQLGLSQQQYDRQVAFEKNKKSYRGIISALKTEKHGETDK